MNLQVKNKGEFYWLVLLMMIWGRVPLLGYVHTVFVKLPFLSSFADYVLPFLFISVMIASGRYWASQLSSGAIRIFFIMELVALLNIAFYPDNTVYIEKYYLFFAFVCLPYFLAGTEFNIIKLEQFLFYISIVSILIQAAYLLLYGGRAEMSSGALREDMALSYGLLPHVALTTWQAFKRKKIFLFLIPILGIFLMLSMGSRGPIVSYGVFLFLYLALIQIKESNWAKVAVAGAVVLSIRFMNVLIAGVALFIQNVGLSTRIFDFIEQEEFNDQNGRDFIRERLLDNLQYSPIFGFGLGGDRRLVGHYSHNLFLELVVSFGWVLGVILSVVIIITLLRAFIKASNETERAFLLVLFCGGFMTLMFSGSFLDEKFFFLLLGYCFYIIHKSRVPSLNN